MSETTVYDVEAAFFGAFLDKYMKFTGGLFRTPDTAFQDGMTAMLDFLIDAASLPPGARVLDVGAGWGCLLRRLREVRPDVTYVGIGPHGTQNAYVRAVVGGGEILDGCFEELDVSGSFDAVFMVGALCHLRDKRAQLARLRMALRPGGRIVVEDTFFLGRRQRDKVISGSYGEGAQMGMFGWAEMPTLGDFIELAADVGLKPVGCTDATESYRLTTSHWLRRLAGSPSKSRMKSDLLAHFRLSQLGWNKSVTYDVLTLAPIETPATKCTPLATTPGSRP